MKKQLKDPRDESGSHIYSLRFLVIMLIPFLFTLASYAQNNNTRFWLDTGLGFATAGGGNETQGGGGLSLRAAGHLQINKVLISVPLTLNDGGKSSYKTFLGGNMRDEFIDTGLLFGYAVGHNSDLQLTFSAGVSRVSGRRVVKDTEECWLFCSGGTKESFDALMGVPVEIGFYSLGSSAFGMGFVMHVNFNREETFAGFSLNLMIGDRN